MFALEELYDSVLELEQMRREMPPPTAMDEIERWNAACAAKVEMIWRRLMVMEPLDIRYVTTLAPKCWLAERF